MDDKKVTISPHGNEALSKEPYFESVFEQAPLLMHVHKKVEKLIAATHLVTEFIKDENEIKWQMRKQSVILLSYITDVVATPEPRKRHHSLIEFKSAAFQLATLCDVASVSKMLSEMNASLLKKEFLLLIERIDAHLVSGMLAGKGSSPTFLASEYFEIGPAETAFSKGHHKGHEMSFKKPMAPTSSNPKNLRPTRQQSSNTDRKTLILSLIKEKKEIGIADAVHIMKGVSTKTVQRELTAMVGEGILKKEGDRRWSRYSAR